LYHARSENSLYFGRFPSLSGIPICKKATTIYSGGILRSFAICSCVSVSSVIWPSSQQLA
jgi:hypothetical protein